MGPGTKSNANPQVSQTNRNVFYFKSNSELGKVAFLSSSSRAAAVVDSTLTSYPPRFAQIPLNRIRK